VITATTVRKIIFKSTSHYKKKVREKNSEKDIVFLVDLSEPLKLNLEMNRSDTLGQPIIDRNTYYLSNLFGSGLKRSNEYKDLKMTIQYNFNLDYVDKLEEPLIDEYVYQNSRGNVLTEKVKIVHINIKQMANMWYNGEYKKFETVSPILFGLSALMLESEKNKFEKLAREIKMDSQIKEQLERIVMDMNVDDELFTKCYDLEEEREKMYEAMLEWEVEQKVKQKVEQAVSEAVTKAVTKNTKELDEKYQENQKLLILNMYQQGISIEKIAVIMNLNLEEVKKTINQK